jgi:hypothetical protein
MAGSAAKGIYGNLIGIPDKGWNFGMKVNLKRMIVKVDVSEMYG